MTELQKDKVAQQELKRGMDRAIEKARAARTSLSTSLRLLSSFERQTNSKRELSTELPVRVKRLKFIYQQTFKLDKGYEQLVMDRRAGIEQTKTIQDRKMELSLAYAFEALGKVAEFYFSAGKVSTSMEAFLTLFEEVGKANEYGGILKELFVGVTNSTNGKKEDAAKNAIAAASKTLKLLGADVTALTDLICSTATAQKTPKATDKNGQKASYVANLVKLLKSILMNLKVFIELTKHETRGSKRIELVANVLGSAQTVIDFIASGLKAYEEYEEAKRLAKMSGQERFNISEMIGWSDEASTKELNAFSAAVFGQKLSPAEERKAATIFLKQIKTVRSASAWRQALLSYLQEAKQQIKSTSDITARLKKDFKAIAGRLPAEFDLVIQTISDMCEAFAKLREKADRRWGYVDIATKTVQREIDQFATTASEASHRLILLNALRCSN